MTRCEPDSSVHVLGNEAILPVLSLTNSAENPRSSSFKALEACFPFPGDFKVKIIEGGFQMPLSSLSFNEAKAREADMNGFPSAKYSSREQNVLSLWRSSSPSTARNLPSTPQEGCPELSRIPLFSKLPAEGLRQLSLYGVARTYPKNTILIHEKDQGESLYVILSGKVKIYVSNEEGKEIILNILNPGEYFGELELIDTGPYSASVMTLERSQIYMISRAGLHYYLLEYPTIALELLHSLALRIRLLTESVKSFALDNVYQRVIRTLLNLATERDGTLAIEQRLTQQDVADRVGASREMVSHILKELNAGGYIKIKDRKITIQRKLPLGW